MSVYIISPKKKNQTPYNTVDPLFFPAWGERNNGISLICVVVVPLPPRFCLSPMNEADMCAVCVLDGRDYMPIRYKVHISCIRCVWSGVKDV